MSSFNTSNTSSAATSTLSPVASSFDMAPAAPHNTPVSTQSTLSPRAAVYTPSEGSSLAPEESFLLNPAAGYTWADYAFSEYARSDYADSDSEVYLYGFGFDGFLPQWPTEAPEFVMPVSLYDSIEEFMPDKRHQLRGVQTTAPPKHIDAGSSNDDKPAGVPLDQPALLSRLSVAFEVADSSDSLKKVSTALQTCQTELNFQTARLDQLKTIRAHYRTLSRGFKLLNSYDDVHESNPDPAREALFEAAMRYEERDQQCLELKEALHATSERYTELTIQHADAVSRHVESRLRNQAVVDEQREYLDALLCVGNDVW